MSLFLIPFLISLLSVFIYINELNKKYLTIKSIGLKLNISILLIGLLFLFFIIYSGLRSKVIGNDTDTYLEIFEDISLYGIDYDLKSRYELFYLYLNKAISYISTNSVVFLMIISFVVLSGYYRFIIKNSAYICFTIALFFFLRYFDDSMNVLRQSIALVILLKAYEFILRGKFAKFFIMVIFASLFHKTAFVFILAYMVRYFSFNKRNILLITVAGLALSLCSSFLINYLMSSYYNYYLDGDYLGETRLASVLSLLFNVVLLLLCYKILTNKYVSEDLKNQFYLVLVGTVILLVSLQFNLLDRVAGYFNVFLIVLIPNAIKKIHSYRKRFTLITLVIIFVIIYYYAIVVLKPDWNSVYPYKTIFYD